jgi:hypothetical protein
MVHYNWDFYYNFEGENAVRANLVYTPYISPDKKTFCMSFNRNPAYHQDNTQWTDDMLIDRFNREIKFHNIASSHMPTIPIIDIDYKNKNIFLEWYNDDFYMEGLKNNGYDNVLVDWKSQWKILIKKMQYIGIIKFSLHPNSWVVKDSTLIPFNWFFSYMYDEPPIDIKSLLVQISDTRQEKLNDVLLKLGMDVNTKYNVNTLQKVCFNSFRSNYPQDLIDDIL